MAAMELLCQIAGITPSHLARKEILFLEAELLARICEELKEFFRKKHRNYFQLMKFNTKMENTMLETEFVRLIIADILSTQDYTLQGIAHYTDTHEDVIQEVIDGRNTSPSATLLRRCIDLHRSVRRDLYRSIMNKCCQDLAVS